MTFVRGLDSARSVRERHLPIVPVRPGLTSIIANREPSFIAPLP